ncbi:polysaccharide pyruvyl transferase family protein [Herbiconiux sp. 11R-BC]|uniref:polysaccharide pyruvyl transferase family protein n=1 Tax=Herbiconiux sp. 11R-BC TaxID=3111637 RepID=UPI003C03AFE2
MRLLMIGDVGVVDDMIHIGDEAMFDEALHRLRLRGARQVSAISANPAETAERYGVAALARIGFSSGPSFDRAADEERMRRVERTAAGEGGLLPASDPAHAVIDAVRAADGVLVTGGGNLASTWPLHVFERATLARVAAVTGTPFVVSGQTFGPELSGADRALVAGMLDSARLTGAREPHSAALARELGVPEARLHSGVDDASFVGDREGAAPAEAAGPDAASWPSGYCAVTFSSHLGGADPQRFVSAAARLLDGLADGTGLGILFVAHFGSLRAGELRGDSVLHERVAAAMSTPSRAVVPPDSIAAARLARAASFVVTSRYHPAVFSASGGVPGVGLSVDEYTRVKLSGAFGNFGQDAVLPLDEVLAADRSGRLLRHWADRDRIRQTGLARAVEARAASEDWWDTVAEALGG